MGAPENQEPAIWSLWDRPRVLASSLTSTVAGVTAFLTGCCNCRTLPNGCLQSQDVDMDGAWFDVEQLQGEHPYCYVNPVAVEGINSSPIHSSSSDSMDVHTRQPSRTKPVLALNGHVTLMKELKHVQNQQSEGDSIEKLNSRMNGHIIPPKNGYVHTSSFATKIEEDRRERESDSLRAEGKALQLSCKKLVQENHLNNFTKYSEVVKSPRKIHIKSVFDSPEHSNVNDNEHSEFDDAILEDLEVKRLQGEIWRASELEDAFSVYNLAAFYSYGTTQPTPVKENLTKTNNDKFVETFPSNFHNNNNNTIKVYRPESECDAPLSLQSTHQNEETGPQDEDDEQNLKTKQELNEFIKLCIFMENVDDVSNYFTDNLIKTDNNCDNKNIVYSGTSFNKHLIFDLVKETMNCCIEDYSNTLLLSNDYPVHLVQNIVIKKLESFNNKSWKNNIPSFLSEDIQVLRERFLLDNPFDDDPIDKLIVNVVADELRCESKQWQNVEEEEEEIKEAVTEEIFKDLLNNTALILNNILTNTFINNTDATNID